MQCEIEMNIGKLRNSGKLQYPFWAEGPVMIFGGWGWGQEGQMGVGWWAGGPKGWLKWGGWQEGRWGSGDQMAAAGMDSMGQECQKAVAGGGGVGGLDGKGW